ncbi:DUF2480 family protein [Flavobacteriaceae bacterium]|nr:DUF2480 family protein [Flavobacteriaceae bacterium]
MIENKVAKSPLITIDLEDFYPKNPRVKLDISPWLFQGMILREKEFRAFLEEVKWDDYQDQFVALYCSEDAIIPAWAYLLLTTKLTPYAKKIVVGSLNLLEDYIFQDIINEMDVEQFRDRPVIIKGCAKVDIPESAYTNLISKIYPVVKSLMFGEACSTVPLYKRKK